MIRVKLTLLTQQMLLHINPSHQDEPFQSGWIMVDSLCLGMGEWEGGSAGTWSGDDFKICVFLTTHFLDQKN